MRERKTMREEENERERKRERKKTRERKTMRGRERDERVKVSEGDKLKEFSHFSLILSALSMLQQQLHFLKMNLVVVDVDVVGSNGTKENVGTTNLNASRSTQSMQERGR